MSTSVSTENELYPLLEKIVLTSSPNTVEELIKYIGLIEADIALHENRARLARATCDKLQFKLNRLRREAGDLQ